MKILMYLCISFFLFSSTEVDFFHVKLEKGKNKKKVYVVNGQTLDGVVDIVNFPEELSVASNEGVNISGLCEMENINMTKISRVTARFEKGYSTFDVKCYDRKNILFYESKILQENSSEVLKYDINGILDQKKHYIDDIAEFTSYYNNGQILKEGKYKKNKKEGIWKEYYKDGKIKSITEFKKDRIINIEKY